MAGLNFQTQTIINSNLDPDSGKKLFISGTDEEAPYVKILRDFIFYKDKPCYGKTLRVAHKVGHDATMCKATLNFTNLALAPTEPDINIKYYRLDIYLGVEGAEPFIYSTPWVQKGMPLWVEFSVKKGEEASAVVTKLAKIIKDTHAFLCDKDLINVNASVANLELTGATEYQRFKKIEIVEFKDDDIYETKVAEIDGSKIVLNARGANSFGSYSQIVKDLRLPTAANYQWSHIRQVETPILGAIYDQFIVDYEAPATNDGLQCVGQRMNSVTTHVFWVKSDIAGEFNTAMGKIATVSLSPEEAIETADVADDTNMSKAKTPKPADVDHKVKE